jgi:hypothetical protein
VNQTAYFKAVIGITVRDADHYNVTCMIKQNTMNDRGIRKLVKGWNKKGGEGEEGEICKIKNYSG